MLSLTERLLLLEKELSKVTPEELYSELQSYEAVGPLAYNFLEETKNGSVNIYDNILNSIDSRVDVLKVNYVQYSGACFSTSVNDHFYDSSLAA